MSYVATLVSAPDRPVLTGDVVQHVREALPNPLRSQWLAEHEAVDIFFAAPQTIDQQGFHATIRHALKDLPVDVFVQVTSERVKRLFIADMDSTMIGQECLDELADFVGKKAHVAEITERAMRGEIAFEPALRERVALLKGLRANVVAEVLEQRITLNPGGRELVQTMRANGGQTALVSGGFTVFTSEIARQIGFDENHGNLLETEDESFSGFVREPILGREAKLETLLRLRGELGLKPHETLAIGDGANDLAMIQAAGLGVAYRAKPAVAAAAHARIDHADLTALLYAQGYSREQFVP